MSGWDISFYLLMNAFRIYVIYRFLRMFFEKEDEKRGLPVFYAGYYLINSLGYLFINWDSLNLIINAAGLGIIIICGYRGRTKKKLLSVTLDICMGVLAENLAFSIFVKGKEIPMELYGMFFSVFIFFIFELLIEKTVKIKKEIEISVYKEIFLVFIPAGSIFIGNVLIENPILQMKYLIIALIILLGINVFIFYLYEKMIDDYKSLKDKEMFELQLDMYKKQLEIMKNANDTYQMIRHDIRHHYLIITAYIKNDEKEKALEYLQKLNGYAKIESENVETGNESIDCIVNYSIGKVRELGGKTTVDMKIIENLPVDDFDINIILSNLLLNACEAIEGCDRKNLTIMMRYDRGLLKISICNSYSGRLVEKDGKMKTIKAHPENHGFGIAGVKKVIKKYNGKIMFWHDEKEFQADVILYL